MSCGCKGPMDIQSWNDFNRMSPQDPLDLIAFARLDHPAQEIGVWELTADYDTPVSPAVMIPSPIVIAGENIVFTNGTDSGQNVSDADQWNFSHKTVNTASSLAPPLKKIVFMKAGIQWTNQLPLTFPVSPAFVDLQLSFMENAATRGDVQGTFPVIRWNTTTYTGIVLLNLILKRTGRFSLGLVGINNNSSPGPGWSMFELDVIAI